MQACSSNAVTIALAHAPRVNSLSELKDFISQSLYYAHDFVYKRELDQADDKLKIIMDPKKVGSSIMIHCHRVNFLFLSSQ